MSICDLVDVRSVLATVYGGLFALGCAIILVMVWIFLDDIRSRSRE